MGCIRNFGGLWTNLDYLRFNPSRINSIQMILAAVMNGKGNGNKDEVKYKILLRLALHKRHFVNLKSLND